MPIDPSNTAVVLIEYQNDFTSDGGVLHGAVEEVMDKTEHAGEHAAGRRRGPAGRRDDHARADHLRRGLQRDQLAPVRHPQRCRRRQRVRQGNLGRRHRRRRSRPQPGDIVVEGKRGLDTFASTNLDFMLRSKGITTIAIGGFLTNCCVESTMRSGYENGYKVITLNDCVAATSIAEHDNALTYDFPMFSEPMSSDEFIAELG